MGKGYGYEADQRRTFWMRTMTVAIVVGITLRYAGFFWAFVAACFLALAFLWWEQNS